MCTGATTASALLTESVRFIRTNINIRNILYSKPKSCVLCGSVTKGELGSLRFLAPTGAQEMLMFVCLFVCLFVRPSGSNLFRAVSQRYFSSTSAVIQRYFSGTLAVL